MSTAPATASANVITGNGGANTLLGLAANDRLLGLGGNDALYGGEGHGHVTFENAGDRCDLEAIGQGTDRHGLRGGVSATNA